LDENFDCPEVKNILARAGIRCRIYKQDVLPNAGSDDVSFLPKVGKRGWLLITADWHQRTRPREAEDLRYYGVKHFAMPGNLGATAMADLLAKAKNDIKACARDYVGHVSCNIQRSGAVSVLRDAQGSLHERGQTKVYEKGKVKTTTPAR
jgi:hypothetical protein